MGRIRNVRTGQILSLEPEFLVGRSSRCELRIDDPAVSSEHAMIRAAENCWLVKDLGSLNRTYADGEELRPGELRPLTLGLVLAFGHEAQSWEVVDLGGPQPMAVPVGWQGEAVEAVSGLLALPSGAEPLATLQREPTGGWVLEDEKTNRVVSDRDRIEVAGREYRLVFPVAVSATLPVSGLEGCSVADLQLVFRTSRDLEHIELEVSCGSVVHQLGARAHNEVLLVLARAMARDARVGLPPSAAGWISADELCRGAAVDLARLNVDIYRVRKQFAELGLVDPAHIVERRPRARLVRLGTGHVEERQL